MQIYSNGNKESLKKDVMELSKEELDYISKTIPLVDTPALFVSRNKIEIIQQMNCTEKVSNICYSSDIFYECSDHKCIFDSVLTLTL